MAPVGSVFGEISAEFVRATRKSVFLAGGLSAANVGVAVDLVRPFGFDVCSGVSTDGNLGTSKLTAFMEVLARAGGAVRRIMPAGPARSEVGRPG